MIFKPDCCPQFATGTRAAILRCLLALLAPLVLLLAAPIARAEVVPAGSFVFNDSVTTIVHAPDGSTYVGGNFTAQVPPGGGAPLASLAGVAKLTADGSLDTSWNPQATGYCVGEDGGTLPPFTRSLALSGSMLYVAGCFGSIGGEPHHFLAALHTDSALASSWNPAPNSHVTQIAVQGSTLFASGFFTQIGGLPRNGLAALSTNTATASPWNPNPNGLAHDFAFTPSTLYIGGYFSTVAGQTRNGLASFDIASGNLTSWNPNQPSIDSLAVSGSTVYTGGVSGLAAFDATTGARTGWNPDSGSIEYWDIAVLGSTIYVAGGWARIAGATPVFLAAYDATTRARTDWAPNPDAPVRALAVSGSTIYAGGEFNFICGRTTGPYAQFDISDPCVNTDTTPPVISIETPTEGQHFAQGASIETVFGCTDGVGSGVASCSAPSTLDTATAGAKTFTVVATDRAGNQSSKSVAYVVDPAPSGSGGGGTTPAFPSVAMIRAQLGRELIRSAKALRIKKLLRTGTAILRFKAPAAGSVIVAWYKSTRGGSAASKGKPVVIATGRRVFSGAQTATIRLKLTRAGKRMLRAAKGRVKLAATATFKADGRPSVVATKVIVLRR